MEWINFVDELPSKPKHLYNAKFRRYASLIRVEEDNRIYDTVSRTYIVEAQYSDYYWLKEDKSIL